KVDKRTGRRPAVDSGRGTELRAVAVSGRLTVGRVLHTTVGFQRSDPPPLWRSVCKSATCHPVRGAPMPIAFPRSLRLAPLAALALALAPLPARAELPPPTPALGPAFAALGYEPPAGAHVLVGRVDG